MTDTFWSSGDRTTFAIGTSVLANFASCTFLSMTRFEPFSRVTRSSLGKLKAAVWTPWLASPAQKISSTTTIGERAPIFGLRYFGSIGRWFSMSWSWPENFSSFALSASSWTVMKDFETGLVVEPFVFVNLVGPDRRLDRAVEFHPGHIARVIVVAQKGVRAGGEELLQGRLGRGRGGFAQEGGGAGQLAFVFDVVGDEGEFPVSLRDGPR